MVSIEKMKNVVIKPLYVLILLLSSMNAYSQTSNSDEIELLLGELMDCYQNKNAGDNGIKSTAIEDKIALWFNNSPHDGLYAKSKLQYGTIMLLKGDRDSAVKAGTEAVSLYRSLYGEDEVYLIFLESLAAICHEAANYIKEKECYKNALSLRSKFYKTDSEQYIIGLQNLILSDCNLGYYNEAKVNCIHALELCKKNGMEESGVYATLLMYLANCYNAQGDFPMGLELMVQSSELQKNLYGENSSEYAAVLNNLGVLCSNMGKYHDAVLYLTESIQIEMNNQGTFPSNIASMLINLGDCYQEIGNNEEAFNADKYSLEIVKASYGECHPLTASALMGEARLCYDRYEYDNAIRLSLKALNVRKEVLGNKHPRYAELLQNIAELFMGIGNYQEALFYVKEAEKIFNDDEGNTVMYATCLSTMASIYCHLGDLGNALESINQSLSILREKVGTSHPLYGSSLTTLASIYRSQNEYDKAIDVEKEALNLYTELYGSCNGKSAVQLHNLSLSYSLRNDYEKALEYAKESLVMRKELYGEKSSNCASSLYSIAVCYRGLDKKMEALESMKDCSDILKKNILTLFKGANASMRNSYWNKYSEIFTDSYPLSFYECMGNIKEKQREIYCGDIFNKSALFAKGLLLNSEMEVRNLIAESRDSDVIRLYDQLEVNRNYLEKMLEKEISERKINTDSLERINETIELRILEKIKTYREYVQGLDVTWRDIQKCLGKDDVAIEFIKVMEDSEEHYFALLLKKDYSAPKLYSLFKDHQIGEINKDEIYLTSEMGNLIWKPLMSELKGMKNIYFSPVGILNEIGIEYLLIDSHKIIADQYNLYRVSSTKQIMNKKNENEKFNVFLYGGIQYDADTQTLVAENRLYESCEDEGLGSVGLSDLIMEENAQLRAGCGYLPGTKTEVLNISSTLSNAGVKNKLFIGTSGTEESFKALSGKISGILHIATHGFYWTETNAEKIKRKHDSMRFLNIISDERTMDEDRALSRSGLMMAGSNRIIKGEKLPGNVEDGILTAFEISKKDFRDVDLVVLSACQTALGDLSGSEGVYGLQRAFKKAGAQTLIMSLWKVDDNATELFMTEFYNNLLSGQTKREAFMNSQRSLREIDDDPNHWAAFIMLDAVE